jgi:TPR repeat protein
MSEASIPSPSKQARIDEAERLILDKDFQRAFDIYKTLAEEGCSYAEVQMGYMLEKGLLGFTDDSKAGDLYKSAKQTGSEIGGFYLALWLENRHRPHEAFAIIKEATDRGYLPAINHLGSMYEKGSGCEPDISATIHYKRHAAAHGHVWALRWLAAYNLAKKGISNKLIGVWQHQKAAFLAFWLTWRRPGDPRLLG